MNHRPYKPRRAGGRWLEEAPEYILDVFDNKGKTADRYTVLFGGSMLEDSLVESRKVYCLDMSSYPTLPWFGFSMWGEWLANKAEVEELYLELLESEVPTDPDVLTYGTYRECVGVERGKQMGFSQALTLVESYMLGEDQ